MVNGPSSSVKAPIERLVRSTSLQEPFTLSADAISVEWPPGSMTVRRSCSAKRGSSRTACSPSFASSSPESTDIGVPCSAALPKTSAALEAMRNAMVPAARISVLPHSRAFDQKLLTAARVLAEHSSLITPVFLTPVPRPVTAASSNTVSQSSPFLLRTRRRTELDPTSMTARMRRDSTSASRMGLWQGLSGLTSALPAPRPS